MSNVEHTKQTGANALPQTKIFPGFSLTGKVALVTGSGRGLGLEIAKGLALAGALVIVNGRSAQNLEPAVTAITAEGGAAVALLFDVADELAVGKAFKQIAQQHGRLDILVNNVGIRDRRALFDFDLSSIRHLIDVDLIATFNLCREAARLMMERREGRIINITSITALVGASGDAAYTAAKGGVCALTRALAAELGSHGITVNAIAPGPFATETNQNAAANPQRLAWLATRSALGRWGQPHEIAGAAVFLASPSASFVTGHILAVDGGLISHL